MKSLALGIKPLALAMKSPALVMLALALGAVPARAGEQGAKELDKELGGQDLCPQVKGIVKAAEKDFERTKGKQLKETEKIVYYEGKLWIPDARGCKLITHKDGSAPFYACELHTSSCKKTSAQYEKLVLDLATCLGNDSPKIKRTEDELLAKFKLERALVTVEFKKKTDDCSINVFVDPVKAGQ